jgi:hypothetical protein
MGRVSMKINHYEIRESMATFFSLSVLGGLGVITCVAVIKVVWWVAFNWKPW